MTSPEDIVVSDGYVTGGGANVPVVTATVVGQPAATAYPTVTATATAYPTQPAAAATPMAYPSSPVATPAVSYNHGGRSNYGGLSRYPAFVRRAPSFRGSAGRSNRERLAYSSLMCSAILGISLLVPWAVISNDQCAIPNRINSDATSSKAMLVACLPCLAASRKRGRRRLQVHWPA